MMRRVKCPEIKVNELSAANYYIYLNKLLRVTEIQPQKGQEMAFKVVLGLSLQILKFLFIALYGCSWLFIIYRRFPSLHSDMHKSSKRYE